MIIRIPKAGFLLGLVMVVQLFSSNSISQTKLPASSNPDSVPSPDTIPEKRHIYAGIQINASFTNFQQQNLFLQDIDTLFKQLNIKDSSRISKSDSTLQIRRKNSKILQPYQKIIVGAPIGVFLGIPVHKHFDLIFEWRYSWIRQKAVLEYLSPDIIGRAGTDTVMGSEKKYIQDYAIQTNLGGIGLRFHIPQTLMTLDGNQTIYIGYTRLWNLGGSEIYSYAGSANANKTWPGVGNLFYVGYQLKKWRQLTIYGNLMLSQIRLQSDSPWSSVLLGQTSQKMDWKLNKLVFNFQIGYAFGPAPKKDGNKTVGD